MPSFLFFPLGASLKNSREEVVHVDSLLHSALGDAYFSLQEQIELLRSYGCLGFSVNKDNSYQLDV